MVARAAIIDAGADPRIAKEALARTAAAIPADLPPPIAARGALPHRGRARGALRGVAALPRIDPTRGFDLVPSNRTGNARIPGFKGDVFDKSDGKSFSKAIDQYAVSSYSREDVKSRMTPRFVVIPQDAEDVVRAITFASHQGLSVVARSGGHQYCGLSSGGSDTLLVDMRLFRKLEFSGTQPPSGAPAQLLAGPGVQLKDASRALRAQEVAIPHGECPRVNLGGHVQSGGIGHTLRSLGATLDWVRSFKMVTRDPASPPGSDVYAEREFSRPTATGATPPTDADLFAAVLGGGPSSWGVLTEMTFDLVADSDHLDSGGYSYAYPYVWGQTKSGFRAAMEQFQRWTIRESNGTLPKGIDLFLSVISGDTPRPPVLLVETMSATKAGLAEVKKVIDAVDAAVPFRIRGAAHVFTSVKGKTPLSAIAAEGVREIGMTGLPESGREFDLPYKKSVYVTKAPFSDLFLDRFVELVDDVYNSKGVKVVFQGAIGGGRYGANGQKGTTHMQRRDALVQLVFDVFYEAGSKSKAEGFQRSMRALLGEYSGGSDLRMLWGSFEDEGTNGLQLDMSIPATRRLYYDSPAEYARLRRIKKYTDPKDLFRTAFTVGLP